MRTVSRVNLLIRAQRDLDRGEPWMARDRLVGALAQRGTDEALLDLLAQSYVALGDLPAAGAAWFVSVRPDDDPAVVRALEALRSRHPKPHVLAAALPTVSAFERYPSAAQARLRELAVEIHATGWSWSPPRQPQRPVRSRVADAVPGPTRSWGDHVFTAIVLAVALASILFWVLGLVSVIGWLTR
jgi:hypothetical protein